jgi:hypothetical protein
LAYQLTHLSTVVLFLRNVSGQVGVNLAADVVEGGQLVIAEPVYQGGERGVSGLDDGFQHSSPGPDVLPFALVVLELFRQVRFHVLQPLLAPDTEKKREISFKIFIII